MKVHLVEIYQDKKREYMCLNELGDPRGCQMCRLYGSDLVESRLDPPQDVTSKCVICDESLVNFLDLPNEQKTAVWGKKELDFLSEKLVYCQSCRTTYPAKG